MIPVEIPKRCGVCPYFELSKLDDYGYCGNATRPLDRARFLHKEAVCILLKGAHGTAA